MPGAQGGVECPQGVPVFASTYPVPFYVGPCLPQTAGAGSATSQQTVSLGHTSLPFLRTERPAEQFLDLIRYEHHFLEMSLKVISKL